jgi:hypothetical protein
MVSFPGCFSIPPHVLPFLLSILLVLLPLTAKEARSLRLLLTRSGKTLP